jgi:hypothetical protein
MRLDDTWSAGSLTSEEDCECGVTLSGVGAEKLYLVSEHAPGADVNYLDTPPPCFS